MEIKQRSISYKKHLLSFLITLMIFIVIFSISSILETKRFDYLEKSKEDLQKEISLLSELRADFCAKIEASPLQEQINKMENNLMVLEANVGKENLEIVELKRGISSIQWEYLKLVEKSNLKCEFNLIPIIYIYSTEDGTDGYQAQKFVFAYLNKKYSNLRFFSFDYDLELKKIENLKSKNFIKKDRAEQSRADLFPIIKIGDRTYYGFKDLKEMEKILEEFVLKIRENKKNME